MVNALRYKIYKETIEAAINRYSHAHWDSYWKPGIENEVYELMATGHEYFTEYFTQKERDCMKDLVRDGLWLTNQDGEILLHRFSIGGVVYDPAFDSRVNGAD